MTQNAGIILFLIVFGLPIVYTILIVSKWLYLKFKSKK
jgi:hypothetical protein